MKVDGFELLRQLYQDHLELRAEREERLGSLIGADGVAYNCVEADHCRRLVTIFGEVRVRRLAYRRKGASNLHPADSALNLPAECYSHGLRALAATEAARGSFGEAVAAVGRASATEVPKRPGQLRWSFVLLRVVVPRMEPVRVPALRRGRQSIEKTVEDFLGKCLGR